MASESEQSFGGNGRGLEEDKNTARAANLRPLAESHGADIVPEIFPDSGVSRVTSEDQSSMQRQRLIEGREGLVGILSAVRTKSKKPVWTMELAQEINRKVGQHLGDEVPIRLLIVPTKEQISSKRFDPSEGFGRARDVNQKTLVAFDTSLRALIKAGIRTLGALRGIRPGNRYEQWVGPVRLKTFDIVKAAFARPQRP